MAEITSTSCCGVKEIHDIIARNPRIIALDTGDDFFYRQDKCAFYIFTDICSQKFGKRLTKYIEKNQLGKVQKSITKRNPNSENRLIIYTWAIKIKAFKEWWLKQPDRQKEIN